MRWQSDKTVRQVIQTRQTPRQRRQARHANKTVRHVTHTRQSNWDDSQNQVTQTRQSACRTQASQSDTAQKGGRQTARLDSQWHSHSLLPVWSCAQPQTQRWTLPAENDKQKCPFSVYSHVLIYPCLFFQNILRQFLESWSTERLKAQG